MLCITLELILPLTFFLAMFLNFSFVFLTELVFRVTTQLFCLLMKSLQNPKYLSVHNLKYGSIGCLNKYCLKQILPSDPPVLSCSCPIGWHICFLIQLNSHKMADLSIYYSPPPEWITLFNPIGFPLADTFIFSYNSVLTQRTIYL